MEDKTEEVFALSDDGIADDGDFVDSKDGLDSPTPATVPKKRGRPANSEKSKEVVNAGGRGKGRPPAAKAVVSEEEGTGSDGGSPAFNGDAVESPTAVASKRGRKPKAKRKISHIVDTTGKGRGRPKKIKSVGDDDNGEVASNNHKPENKAAKKGRGRPKKVRSDESSDDKQDDDQERRPVGRPPSGAVNLHIAYTGRGKGRPKKKVAEKRAADAIKRTAEVENGGGQIKRQRGRPSTSSKVPYVPTGKSRGRPKVAVQEKESQDDEEEDVVDGNSSKEVAENSADLGEENDKANSESEDI